MRPLVLVLALAALLAPAHPASILKPELEKKLDDIKDVPDKAPEIIDDANTIKDSDNQLKTDPIPVKVVEDLPKDVEDTVKRVEIDLKHPGEPQRQEHETQNPEHYEDEQGAVAAVKQMIKNTQVVFNKGFADVSEHIVDWVSDNKPEVTIIESIQQLRDTFTENIDKINSTIQSYWTQADDSEKKVDIQKVQSGLKVLEEKFETGVQTLNNGVRNLAVLKETRDDTSTTAKPVQGIQFPGFVTNFWSTVTQGFGNVTNQFQNIIGQSNSTAVGVQSDETSASTSKPSVWQGIQTQIQGIFQGRPQGAQSDEQPAQTGPFAQVIQNVPLLQNFVNFIQPKPQSAEPSKPAQATSSEGSNVVPVDPAKPDQQQKKPDEPAVPAAQPAPATQGPIQQIIQKNPIVQGIAGAVQKIQHSINNPEKPREESAGVKAGWYGVYGYGHRPINGDNNNVSGSGVKNTPVEAERPSDEAAASQEAKPASPEVPASPEAVKQD